MAPPHNCWFGMLFNQTSSQKRWWLIEKKTCRQTAPLPLLPFHPTPHQAVISKSYVCVCACMSVCVSCVILACSTQGHLKIGDTKQLALSQALHHAACSLSSSSLSLSLFRFLSLFSYILSFLSPLSLLFIFLSLWLEGTHLIVLFELIGMFVGQLPSYHCQTCFNLALQYCILSWIFFAKER